MFPFRDFEARFREILERLDALRDGAAARRPRRWTS